jgi:hypothetical protein
MAFMPLKVSRCAKPVWRNIEMKYAISSLVLLAGLAAGAPAFAERWVTPVNGSVSAVMMQDGAVMMKVQMPPKEFNAMQEHMKAGEDNCRLMEIYPGATDTVILTCGG